MNLVDRNTLGYAHATLSALVRKLEATQRQLPPSAGAEYCVDLERTLTYLRVAIDALAKAQR